MEFISIPLTFGIGAYAFYKLIELYARRKERLMIIEKLSEIKDANLGNIDLTGVLGEKRSYNKYLSLRIGSLLMGLGLGLLIGYLIITFSIGVVGDVSYHMAETMSIIYGASTLCFGGIGLIAGFIAETILEKRR